jgi:hypothetical protein
MSVDMTLKAADELRAPFPPDVIGKIPKGGALLDYVGHAAVTDRLLKVDPAWTWEPFATDERGLPALDADGNLWIRLTVCGVTRPGVGDGKNAKELISDALRNAAMRFGVALDLWSKEDLTANRTVDDYKAALAHLSEITDLDLLRSLYGQAVALGHDTAAEDIKARAEAVKG